MQIELVILFIIIVVVFFFLSYYFSSRSKVKRGLNAAPRKNISDVQENELVRVSGTVVAPGRKLIAPLSGRECVYYLIEVTQRVSSGKSSHWRTIIRDEMAGDVFINDGTGYALIDTRKAEKFVLPDKQFSSGTFNDATPELEDYLRRHSNQSTGLLGFNKELRYREGVLEEGEICTASGFARMAKNENRFPELKSEKFVVITVSTHGTVFISDDPALAQN